MPSLAEELTLTTVRLEGNTSTGSTVGTGFLFIHEQRVFVITNKHVINGVIDGNFKLHISNEKNDGPQLGKTITVPFNQQNFIGHPDPEIDVTAMNLSAIIDKLIAQGTPAYFKSLSVEQFPIKEHFDKFIGPMEDIIFIGYPSGIWDVVNIAPIARRGMTATPCYVDFNGTKTFLIDASVFPGSSGSPVFIYYAGGHPDKEGNLYAGNRIHLLGLIAKVFHRQQEGDIQIVDIPTAQRAVAQFQQMIDLGIVFKWDTIIECIENYIDIANKLEK